MTTLDLTKISDSRCTRLSAGDYAVGPQYLYPARSISIIGEGEGVTRLHFDECGGPHFNFAQSGYQQPHGLTMEGLSLVAKGRCGTALSVNYGAPEKTSDHYRPSVRLTNVVVESGDGGSWANGIDLADAWNVTLDNVYVSGSSANGVWNDLSGVGINFRRMCVNAHLTNVRTNFWATGIQAHSDGRCNTEGIFAANCSMVGVKRGVWIRGSRKVFPHRISTFSWVGGMIEARVGGVVGGSAAFHLDAVHTALIQGCQMLTETVTENVERTFGVFIENCRQVIVTGNDINSWTNGVHSQGDCSQIVSENNTFVNCALPRS